MDNLIDPTTGRSFLQGALLKFLMSWTEERRILKAMYFSTRAVANIASMKILIDAIGETVKDKTGGGMTERDTIIQTLNFLEDPNVVRIIARMDQKHQGVTLKAAIKELRDLRAELEGELGTRPLVVH